MASSLLFFSIVVPSIPSIGHGQACGYIIRSIYGFLPSLYHLHPSCLLLVSPANPLSWLQQQLLSSGPPADFGLPWFRFSFTYVYGLDFGS
ncbi:hypothetical protein F4775DRAFT_18660 [Biscogniauxia sp. FL1348]|nr:hypothetical protein F4775DRAFT_18660 [Biscogniauxia sp. FL1348]